MSVSFPVPLSSLPLSLSLSSVLPRLCLSVLPPLLSVISREMSVSFPVSLSSLPLSLPSYPVSVCLSVFPSTPTPLLTVVSREVSVSFPVPLSSLPLGSFPLQPLPLPHLPRQADVFQAYGSPGAQVEGAVGADAGAHGAVGVVPLGRVQRLRHQRLRGAIFFGAAAMNEMIIVMTVMGRDVIGHDVSDVV